MQNLNVLPNIVDKSEKTIERTDRRELSIKSRGGNGTTDVQLNKVLTLSKMDQEILQNYKIRVQNLEDTLKSKKEEILSLTRNFEALCLKSKEDSNLIKKLEEEINFIKTKDRNAINKSSNNLPKFDDENLQLIRTYKDKIDSQAAIIKELENKNSTNTSRFNERDKFYKSYTLKLEEKIQSFTKTIEGLEKEKNSFKKESDKKMKEYEKINAEFGEKEDQIQKLKERNKELDNIINELRSKHELILEQKESELKNKLKTLNDQQKKNQNSINMEEKLRSENEIFNKLIQEVKLRNKILEENLEKANENLLKKDQETLLLKETVKTQITSLLRLQENEFLSTINFMNERLLLLTAKLNCKFNRQIREKIEAIIKVHKTKENELQSQISYFTQELKKFKDSLSDNDLTTFKLDEMEKEFQKTKEELGIIKPFLVEKEKLISTMKARLKELEHENETLKVSSSLCDDLKKKNNKLEDIIRVKDESLHDYVMKLNEANEYERKVKSQNESYRSLLLAAEEKVKNFDQIQLDSEAKLNCKISSLENVIEHLKADYEAMKKDYDFLKSKGSGVERVKNFFQQLISANSKVT